MGEVVKARPLPHAASNGDPRLEAMWLQHEIAMFNTAYAAALDEQRLMDWVEMFTDDGFYLSLIHISEPTRPY